MSASTIVREARRSAGLTQAQLAALSGLTQPAIARLERPGADPRMSTLLSVLAAAQHGLVAAPVADAMDHTQLRERLALSPAQRLATFAASQRRVDALRSRARRVSAEFDVERLLRALHDGGVDFVVIGGIAAVLHGSSRSTFDLDVTFATEPENREALGAVLVALGARLRGGDEDVTFVPDGATLRRVEVLTLSTDAGDLDVRARPSGAPRFATLRDRADRYDVGGFTVRVATPEDLIAMKLAAARPKDLADVVELEAILRLRRA